MLPNLAENKDSRDLIWTHFCLCPGLLRERLVLSALLHYEPFPCSGREHVPRTASHRCGHRTHEVERASKLSHCMKLVKLTTSESNWI